MKNLVARISIAMENIRLRNVDFVIISNNCWGYEIYNGLKRKYSTPFVGIFFYPEDYITLLENFENYIFERLEFTKHSKYKSGILDYPVGLLSSKIEIHFLHYRTEAEALEKWNRRIERLKNAINCNFGVFVKFDDRDGCESDHIARFHKLKFENKLSLGIKKFDSPNHLHIPLFKDAEANSVVDGLTLFRARYLYFDVSKWILYGRVGNSLCTYALKLLSQFIAILSKVFNSISK
jgi:uncharacterized protein (DUF1919 family)